MDASLMFDGLDENELPLDCIESPLFADARSMMNVKLCELLGNLESGNFQAGTVMLKLTLGIVTAYTEVAEEDIDYGGERKKMKGYKAPELEYEVKLSLQRNSRETGKSREQRVFVEHDGRFVAAPVPTDQVTFDELSCRRGQ